jgi:hypothetical protein
MPLNTANSQNEVSTIPFPEIPEWDGISSVQIISPVDNPENTGLYGKTNNHLDKVTRIFPRSKNESEEKLAEPHREVIWLGGIMHRGPFAMIDFYNTFNEKYKASFAYFDHPKATYELDHIADQVVDYLRQLVARDTDKEFVICGASAGEMLSRRVYEKLNTQENEHILPHIKHHFSVCGISTYDELSIPQKGLVKTAETAIWRKALEGFARRIPGKVNAILGESIPTKIIWDTFFAPIGERFSSKLQRAWEERHGRNEWEENIGTHLNKSHRKRGALWLTRAHYGILQSIHEQTTIQDTPKNTPPTTILYSTDDMTYANPKRNAETEKWFYRDVWIEPVEKWGHVDVVFQSEKYLKAIERQLQAMWK